MILFVYGTLLFTTSLDLFGEFIFSLPKVGQGMNHIAPCGGRYSKGRPRRGAGIGRFGGRSGRRAGNFGGRTSGTGAWGLRVFSILRLVATCSFSVKFLTVSWLELRGALYETI